VVTNLNRQQKERKTSTTNKRFDVVASALMGQCNQMWNGPKVSYVLKFDYLTGHLWVGKNTCLITISFRVGYG
jgi:hypothetical protein